MWDRPGLLNGLADALFGFAALLVLGGAMAYAVQLPIFSLLEVRIDSPVEHVTRDQIEDVVRRELKGNFFTINLAATRAAFERLPWVRNVNIRRQWPGRLDVALEEHVPFARWATTGLVNTHGEVFEAAYDGDLPVFLGPEGSAREIAIQYRYFRRSLAAIDETPVQVQMTPRRAWQVKLGSGLVLALGRENVEVRLARFVATYARTVGRLGRRVEYIDLRYANGFAVRIPELRNEKNVPARGRRPAQGA